MSSPKNLGFDPDEIKELQAECKAQQATFVYVDDEEDPIDDEEYAHVFFVGKYDDKEVIYDLELVTLRMHFSTVVYQTALEKVMKVMPLYVPLHNRDETYKANDELDEEAELLIMEMIEEIEETEEVKVQEHVQIIKDLEYGIGLDVALNVDEISEEVIEEFIQNFNSNKLKLDATLYSFKSGDEDDY
jgi:hypothetical protein